MIMRIMKIMTCTYKLNTKNGWRGDKGTGQIPKSRFIN